MRPFIASKQKEKRFIIYDCEAKTNYQPDPDILKFTHEAINFLFSFLYKN